MFYNSFFFLSLPLRLAVGLWGEELVGILPTDVSFVSSLFSIYYTLMSTFVLRFLVMSVQFCVLFFKENNFNYAPLPQLSRFWLTHHTDVRILHDGSFYPAFLLKAWWRISTGGGETEHHLTVPSHKWSKTQIHQWRLWVDTCIGETAAAGGARTGMPLRGLRAVEWMWPEWPGPSERTARLRGPWKQQLRYLDGGNKKAGAPTETE